MDNGKGFNPETGEWNDSLTGNYLWANTNIGETLSGVLTPFTWSLIQESFELMNVLPGHPTVGNIGGRAYNNVSVMATALRALGRSLEDLNKEMGGVREDYQDGLPAIMIPIPGVSGFQVLKSGLLLRLKQKAAVRKIPGFLAGNVRWFAGMQRKLEQIEEKSTLLVVLQQEIVPYVMDSFWMVVGSAWEYGELVGKLRRDLVRLVGREDADVLLSNVSQEADFLASLGPALGLAQVARGEIDRQTYLERWGHRGPAESEVAAPRPAENPGWLSQQLDTLARAEVGVETLLARQRSRFDEAWSRFAARDPQKAGAYKRRLDRAARAARVREAVRSEQVRLILTTRSWALRVGDATGLGEDIFYLTKPEVIGLLSGNDGPVPSIPRRQATYAKYRGLPPYPAVIRGAFDPFRWAADPGRRTDYYDPEGVIAALDAQADRADPTRATKVLGVPGAAGVVEGVVRRLDSPDEGDQLQPGEILVTSQTNIGWSPLFPLAKAIVTDVGAALSHAAIVARELGIPAVVNCGDATTRLHTGDRVRVDGSRGVVEILNG